MSASESPLAHKKTRLVVGQPGRGLNWVAAWVPSVEGMSRGLFASLRIPAVLGGSRGRNHPSPAWTQFELSRVDGWWLIGRMPVDRIPSRGSRARLAWCVLVHPCPGYTRNTCSVQSSVLLRTPLGEHGSEIGHLRKTVVELALPRVPASDLEPIARAQHDHFLGQAQRFDLPLGQPDPIVRVDVHLLRDGVENHIELRLIRIGRQARVPPTSREQLVVHLLGVEPKRASLRPRDAEPSRPVRIWIGPIPKLRRHGQTLFGVDRRFCLSGEWHGLYPQWYSLMGLSPTLPHNATCSTHSLPDWGQAVDRLNACGSSVPWLSGR